MPIGTARLAHLCLPGSELHVGVDFDDDRQVRAALRRRAGGGATAPPTCCFRGRHAIDLAEVAACRRRSRWSWSTAPGGRRASCSSATRCWRRCRRSGSRRPRPATTASGSEPADHCVATVEALAHVLGALEGEPERFAGAAAPVRGDDRHAAALRADRARRAPAARGVPRRAARGAANAAAAAARARRRRRLPARRGERLAGAPRRRPSRRRSCTGSRAARAAARRSRRSSRRAARWRPPIPGHIRIAREQPGGGRELGCRSARAGRR